MSYTERDIQTALTRELTDERVAVAAAYWLDASPHERWVPDGIILARYARYALTRIEILTERLDRIQAIVNVMEHHGDLDMTTLAQLRAALLAVMDG